MRKISILGSTGSIGKQTLEIANDNEDIKICALSANSNIALLEEQARTYKPEMVCVMQPEQAKELSLKLRDTNVKVVTGVEGLIEIATLDSIDMVVTAVVGMIGIRPTIEAIKAGKDIALANKETLVTAGHIIMPLAKECNVRILPVDSEHSAIFQSLNGEDSSKLSKILLTASGGPFRGKNLEDLKNVTVNEALKHPNWSMGRKITIDSASMINKGLEVIEAKWLFDVGFDQIQVVVHPQSIIHSMVEYIDGAVIAQLGTPDMKLPIQYALFYPERRTLAQKKLDFYDLTNLTFEKPDLNTFKGLSLAFEAGRLGGSMPTVLNAANERLVDKFLNNEIKFLDIQNTIEDVMNKHNIINNPNLEQILEIEQWTYKEVESRCYK
ncbi:MAG: 1-deoxy-D-xylulose 5-phosphate reductoisomerase [Clostridiales bacterium]|jgi:1-deoxy-D-xylulose-5-phosphate reductoisomerase|nr:1-deoxy-D-xylulose 5-phosphate reductoisomerase [Clostridiales bacterium]